MLSYEEFLTFTRIPECHYCGAVIPWHPKMAGKNNAYYLDRKDNDKGYTTDNCVVCCSRCNWAKANRFTYEEWVYIGKAIRGFREAKCLQ